MPTINFANATGTFTYEEITTPPPEGGGGTPPPDSSHGLVTGFNASSGSQFQVDGIDVAVQNANKSWSLKNPDPHTLMFEVRSGDVWRAGSYTDTGCNRSELQFLPEYSEGLKLNLSETITVTSDPANTADWMNLTQLHATTNVSPTYAPFHFNINQAGHLEVVMQEPHQSGNNYAWRSPQPIVRNRPMSLKAEVVMGPTGNGSAKVWLDNAQIVDFNGKVGATNSKYYWKVGLYRGEAHETMMATFNNVHITTG